VIVRMWHGWATPANADAYEEHFESTVQEHLRGVPGFRRAELLRRVANDEVEFIAVTLWDTLDAVRDFAGAAYDRAVVEPEAERVLSRFDSTVLHFHVSRSFFG